MSDVQPRVLCVAVYLTNLEGATQHTADILKLRWAVGAAVAAARMAEAQWLH